MLDMFIGLILMLPRLLLDPSSEVPLYRQLYEKLKHAIEAGQLAKGYRLAPTRELAGQLGLNRSTVSAAYDLLIAEGLLESYVGRGSFVACGAAPVSAPVISGPISFASSRPSEQLFPLPELQEAIQEVTSSPELGRILQLGSPSGYGPLRSYLQAQAGPQDDILVVNGCQQGLDLIQRVFAPMGETVLVEDPVYPGLKNVFQRAGARLIGVPVGFDGLQTETLLRLIRQERPRLVVVTPNFQNPTGTTMPLAARQELLAAAAESGSLVIENDIYGDLRYEGESLPSLKSLDQTGAVVQLRSFSKVGFPGLRVGWISASRSYIARLAEAKQWCDLHTDQLSQAILLRFAESGRLAAHRERMIEAGRERLAAALQACAEFLPAGTRYTRPQGGMSLWVELPAPHDAAELLPACERAGVTYLPGRHFAVAGPHPGGLRLSFAAVAPEQIRQGIALVGKVCAYDAQRRWEELSVAIV